MVVIVQSRLYDLPAWRSGQLDAMRMLEPKLQDAVTLDKKEAGKMTVSLKQRNNGPWRLERDDSGEDVDETKSSTGSVQRHD